MEAENMTKKITKNKKAEERKTDENVIFVGRKPPMSYVLAVVTQFNGNGTKDVIIKARGRSISTAVDTAEIVRNRFVQNAKVKNIKIDTESMTNEEGRDSNVSSIEISLTIVRERERIISKPHKGRISQLLSIFLLFLIKNNP
jgi:DNA-binding protein